MWVLGGIFVGYYSLMYISVRNLIKFLELQKDCDDKPTMDKCDGKSKFLVSIVITIGVALIFLIWCILFSG